MALSSGARLGPYEIVEPLGVRNPGRCDAPEGFRFRRATLATPGGRKSPILYSRQDRAGSDLMLVENFR